MKYVIRLLVAGASMLGLLGATAPAAHAQCLLVTAEILWSGGGTTGVSGWCASPTPWNQVVQVYLMQPIGFAPGALINIWIPVP
jgi:hypothetical protein